MSLKPLKDAPPEVLELALRAYKGLAFGKAAARGASFEDIKTHGTYDDEKWFISCAGFTTTYAAWADSRTVVMTAAPPTRVLGGDCIGGWDTPHIVGGF